MKKIITSVLIFTNIIIAQTVEIHGALKSVMQGDLSVKFNLLELEGKENIYGLGTVEDLKGEIIIINSTPHISRVVENKILMDSTFKHNASLPRLFTLFLTRHIFVLVLKFST